MFRALNFFVVPNEDSHRTTHILKLHKFVVILPQLPAFQSFSDILDVINKLEYLVTWVSGPPVCEHLFWV